jgi:hypothetical protein
VNKQERQEQIQTHPGVRRLKAPVACEGWKSGTPMKAIYTWGPGRANPPVGREAYACKNPAWWRFTALRRKRSPGWEGVRNLCWSHLIHQGVYGDMDEMARTERWLKRKGWAE